MKKSIFAILVAGGLITLGSQAQAYDRCYDDDYGYSRYEHRETVRYDRPRYYSEDEVIVRPRRVVVDEDYGDRPEYRRHHDSFLRVFLGGF